MSNCTLYLFDKVKIVLAKNQYVKEKKGSNARISFEWLLQFVFFPQKRVENSKKKIFKYKSWTLTFLCLSNGTFKTERPK